MTAPDSRHIDGYQVDERLVIVDELAAAQAQQAAAEASAQVAELIAAIRAYAQAIAPVVREICQAFTQFAEAARAAGLVDEDGTPARRPDRPAWQSPHGPARPHHRQH